MFRATCAVVLIVTTCHSAWAKPFDLSDVQLQAARCTLVSAMVPDEGKITELQRTAGIVYFLGKLRGQLPDVPLDDIFTRELILDVADNLASYRKLCGGELLKVGPEISEMGNRINALADEQSKSMKD